MDALIMSNVKEEGTTKLFYEGISLVEIHYEDSPADIGHIKIPGTEQQLLDWLAEHDRSHEHASVVRLALEILRLQPPTVSETPELDPNAAIEYKLIRKDDQALMYVCRFDPRMSHPMPYVPVGLGDGEYTWTFGDASGEFGIRGHKDWTA